MDAETAEAHPKLSEGQRLHDLAIAEENIIGELLDVEAEIGLPSGVDPEATGAAVRERYNALWSEVTPVDTFAPDERFRIDERLRRLNQLGFDVEEIEVVASDEGFSLRLDPHVVEPGHHRRRLHALTGLNAQENQARRLLNDLARFRDHVSRNEGRPLPESVVVHRWLADVFEPVVAAVPAEFLHQKLEAAEVFHEILCHRQHLSEQARKDVPLLEATRSYVDDVLRHVPDERAVLVSDSWRMG